MKILKNIENVVDLDEFKKSGKADSKKHVRARLAQIHAEITVGEAHVNKKAQELDRLTRELQDKVNIFEPEISNLLQELEK